MNFARNVQAKHLPSVPLDDMNLIITDNYNKLDIYIYIPCDDTALERAKSILLATKIMARVRSSSMSINEESNCSACVNDDLSTTE